MLILPISRGWLFSRIARRTYFLCTLLTLALGATLIGSRAAMTTARSAMLSPDAALVLRTVLYPEIVGTALLWVAILYFWFGFDHSHFLKKALWFLCLMCMSPLATPFYYFLVYRRYAVREGAAQQPPVSSATH
jgi:hypothetical protein